MSLSKQKKKTCAVDGCEKPSRSLKMCDAHYKRFKQYNDPLGRAELKGVTKICPNCGKQFYLQKSLMSRTYCSQNCSLSHRNEIQMTNNPLNCLVCGNEFYCSKSQQKYRNRKTCSLECRGKLQTIKAEKRNKEHPPSIGKLNRRIRYSKKMKEWREAVFLRDNWTCQICGARSSVGNKVILNADHIKPFATHKELRFDLDNGRTLCVECHRNTETYGRTGIFRNA